MKRGELAVKLERWEPLAPCAACFLLTAVLCGAQLFGGYAPFALGLVAAAGSGKRGLAALLGGVAGALVFLDFSHALRTLAVVVLLYTANNAFCETRWYRSRRFLPAMTALMYLAVELVYLLQAGADRAALCLLSIALAVLAAVCARAVLEGKTMNEEQRQAALLVVVTGVLMAASALRLENGFAPGRILAMLLVMLLAYDRSAGTALAAALGIGLAMDLTAQRDSTLAQLQPEKKGHPQRRSRGASSTRRSTASARFRWEGSAGDGAWARRCCGACRSSCFLCRWTRSRA